MSLRGKSRYSIVSAIILLIFIISSNLIYSDNIYPLEAGEKLVEENLKDENRVDIITQFGESFYLKKLQRTDDKWTVESIAALPPRGTGLITDVTVEQGDRKLAAALENELRTYGLNTASLPPLIDYSNSVFLPPAGDQGWENSCVGWATGYCLRTYQQAQDLGWEVKGPEGGINSHIFSPSFIYNQINNGVDKGATIWDAAVLLNNLGNATIADFPYIEGDYRTQPSQDIIQSAYPHRVRIWELLFTDIDSDQYIIQKAKEYLNTKDLIVAGSRVGAGFLYPGQDNNGNWVIPWEKYAPYKHAYVVVGYDDNFYTQDGKGAFKVLSSWGKGWGNDGFCYISYKGFAANAVEGYVFTDLVNSEPQQLATNIGVVTFNMNFSGTGRFDYRIKDANNQLVYEESNLRGQAGVNTLVWDGKDTSGNNVADGAYKLSIIPYKGSTPKPAFELPFTKSGKVESAGALVYINSSGIQYVDIPVAFKADGTINIKISYNGKEYVIISDQPVKAGDSNIYLISKYDFDFNNIDLSQVKIMINVL